MKKEKTEVAEVQQVQTVENTENNVTAPVAEVETVASEIVTQKDYVIDFDIVETYKSSAIAVNECKFICNVKELKNALVSLKMVFSGKNTLPVLDNILCEVTEIGVKMTTSNLENSVVYYLRSETKGSGIILIPFLSLNNYVSNIKEGNLLVNIDIANNTLVINRDNSIFKILCCESDNDEFPILPKVENSLLKVPANLLLQGLKNTLPFVANNELRPEMNGVCFECESQVMRFISTDGHQLACFTLKNLYDSYEYFVEENFCFILGKTGAKVLQTVLKNETGLVKLFLSEKNIKVKYLNIEITLHLVDGKFPNWRHVIPQNNDKTAKINRKELISSVKRIATTANKGSNLIKLHLNGVCQLSSCDLDYEISSNERVKDFSYTGEDIEIGFKSPFLLNILNTIESEKVLIMLSEASRGALILPLEVERNSDYMTLLMPVSLNI